ncbi:ABC transporter ATP-binding protein [Parachlamydia acanthamoebae]|uniref:ABC transporter ATP-binding protein n=1 Tax=Parachlamydia acanthamoebae TaxID=83552 RepID=UPI0032B026E7
MFNSVKDFFIREKIKKQALNNISFSIAEGEVIGLLGPNGAGKTTLLKILSGLIHPSSGTVSVLSKIPYQKDRNYLLQIGVVMGQKSQLLWDIPAIDTLNIISEIYQIRKEEFKKRLKQFIEMLSIHELLDTPVRHLSLGERMKFELIASLIHQPKVLFLDEPTIGLDLVSQRVIRDFLHRINQAFKTTIIITSHYMKDIEVLAQRVMVIKKGSICYDGSIQSLKNHCCRHSHKIYFSTENNDSFQLSQPIERVSAQQFSLSCSSEDLQKNLSEIIEKVPITQLKTEEMSFEEAIFTLFNEKD